MQVPNFARQCLGSRKCDECGQSLDLAACIVGAGLQKRLTQTDVDYLVEIECPNCGDFVLMILDASFVKWDEVVEWVWDIAAKGGMLGEESPSEVGLITAVPPTDIEMDIRTGRKTYLRTQIIGGYQRGKTRIILFRKVQRSAWDGVPYDGTVRLDAKQVASFVDETDRDFLPRDDWARFHKMPSNTRFKLGGRSWRKMSVVALNKMMDTRTTFHTSDWNSRK